MRLLRSLIPGAIVTVAVLGAFRVTDLPAGGRAWALAGIIVGVYVFALLWGAFVLHRRASSR